MKFSAGSLMFLISLTATLAYTQTIPAGAFKHIIIVVMENRTPDNLFGIASKPGKCGVENPFQPGVDIYNGGSNNMPGVPNPTCNMSLPLSAWDADAGVNKIIDPDHGHDAKYPTPSGWVADYDNRSQDGFCHEYGKLNWAHPCPSYSYVQKSDVQPYFDIATAYGFANYMFQSNQGPSFPAHQFLFTGTSAPSAPDTKYDLNFVGENAVFGDSGCPVSSTSWPNWVWPDGSEYADPRITPLECYPHDSLVTSSKCINGVCDKGVSWRYYAPDPGTIWTAPSAIPEVCYGENDTKYAGQNIACGTHGAEWGHMSFYTGKYQGAPIFHDIQTCQLQQISWLMPDSAWSDHPQTTWKRNKGAVHGPDWVADVVNAIGNSWSGSGHKCDYWGSTRHASEPTAILIVWDDWGGWYDHVTPPASLVYRSIDHDACNSQGSNGPNGWGCGYADGFRVPFMVVSEYTGTYNQRTHTFGGYVSGACGPGQQQKTCPNLSPPYIHDFGSILAYTEWNFSLPFIDGPDKGYADYNAPDWDLKHQAPPLSDFFGLYPNNPRPFVRIKTTFPASNFFTFYTDNNLQPTGPDDDNDAD